jgi:L-fuculose-phosphate aldolase
MNEKTKRELIHYSKLMVEQDLTLGTSGNLSARIEDVVLITPSNVDYYLLKPDDIVVIDMKGEVIEGNRNPSIEKMMHLGIYNKRKDIGAVVHSHSKFASALAAHDCSIPPFLDEIVNFLGGEIKTAEYGMPGSNELARYTVESLEGKNAVLLSHHGALACGKDLKTAFENAMRVERAAEIYVLSRILGKPASLPKESIEAETDIFEMRK